MLDLSQKMLGTGLLEARYLQMILLLDQAESMANDLMGEGLFSPEAARAVAQVKQTVLEEFVRNNRSCTLSNIEKMVVQAHHGVEESASENRSAGD